MFNILYVIVEPELILPLDIPNVMLETYIKVPGIKRASVIYRDNLGYMCYKNKTK
jgi:hypothetical protein